MNRGSRRQILSLGKHTGEGLCLCTVSAHGELTGDINDVGIVHPGCPVTGHSARVTEVQFSDDGKQAISSSLDETVRVWDVASGTLIRQFAGEQFALVEGLSQEHKRFLHVITALGDTLSIHKVAKEEQHVEDGAAAAPVACFRAPQPIVSVRCNGATICVGCDEGAVCVLSAPFLTA